MKTKIKSMLASLVIAAAVISVNAQPRDHRQERSPEERAKFMVERMAEKLDLTVLQQEQVLDLHKWFAPEGERPEKPAVKDGERPSKEEMEAKREEMKAKMEARRAEIEAGMKEILTAEQFDRWKEQTEKMHERRPEARHDRGKDSKSHRHTDKESKAAKGDCTCKSNG